MVAAASHLALWPQPAAAAATAASAKGAAAQACSHNRGCRLVHRASNKAFRMQCRVFVCSTPAAAALCNADRCKDPGSAAAG